MQIVDDGGLSREQIGQVVMVVRRDDGEGVWFGGWDGGGGGLEVLMVVVIGGF